LGDRHLLAAITYRYNEVGQIWAQRGDNDVKSLAAHRKSFCCAKMFSSPTATIKMHADLHCRSRSCFFHYKFPAYRRQGYHGSSDNKQEQASKQSPS
jgi:hypothetical protein